MAGILAYRVDDVAAVDLRWLAGAGTVEVVAAASAACGPVAGIVTALRGLGAREVRVTGASARKTPSVPAEGDPIMSERGEVVS